jgi:putative endonuclease
MESGDGAFLYFLRCADGSFYIGVTRTTLEIRIAQHNSGELGGYTATRRPVTLVSRNGSSGSLTRSRMSAN